MRLFWLFAHTLRWAAAKLDPQGEMGDGRAQPQVALASPESRSPFVSLDAELPPPPADWLRDTVPPPPEEWLGLVRDHAPQLLDPDWAESPGVPPMVDNTLIDSPFQSTSVVAGAPATPFTPPPPLRQPVNAPPALREDRPAPSVVSVPPHADVRRPAETLSTTGTLHMPLAPLQPVRPLPMRVRLHSPEVSEQAEAQTRPTFVAPPSSGTSQPPASPVSIAPMPIQPGASQPPAPLVKERADSNGIVAAQPHAVAHELHITSSTDTQPLVAPPDQVDVSQAAPVQRTARLATERPTWTRPSRNAMPRTVIPEPMAPQPPHAEIADQWGGPMPRLRWTGQQLASVNPRTAWSLSAVPGPAFDLEPHPSINVPKTPWPPANQRNAAPPVEPSYTDSHVVADPWPELPDDGAVRPARPPDLSQITRTQLLDREQREL